MHTSIALLCTQGRTQCCNAIVLQICSTIFWYSKVPTGQTTKIAASPAVIIVSKYPQSEMQTLDFLLGICFLIIIIKYIEAKGLAAFGYLTFIYFFSLTNQIIKLDILKALHNFFLHYRTLWLAGLFLR